MRDKKEIRIKGAPVSEGIAIGVPHFLIPMEEAIPEFPITVGEVDGEIARYRRALFSSREDLERLQSDLEDEGSDDAVTIIDTHIQMLDDPMITTHMEEKIRLMGRNTEAVFRSVINEFESKVTARCDSFFRERLIDVMDVSKRILGHLGNKQKSSFCDIPPNSVIFAKELAPSQTAAVNASHVGGFVTEAGGGNSHAALIARSKGIPYVTAIEIEFLLKTEPDYVIVDGAQGLVILNPSQETLREYEKLLAHLKSRFALLEREAILKAETRDRTPIRLLANIGDKSELDLLTQHGAEGVGLFRTEYLLLQESVFFPHEEEQYLVYREVIDQLQGMPLIVRAFDIGGDKNPELFRDLRKEPNPVLGCRGIRFLLRYPEIFRVQLRALFRAAKDRDVRLLLPLIADLNELKAARKIIEEVKMELSSSRSLPVGCMIEVPSAVLIADALAQSCDFFSIGTNDLIQYTLGMDRSDPAMGEICYPAHPSVLRLIKMAVAQAQKYGKHIGICGEIASNPLFIPLLLGLGLREFSCASRYLPAISEMIRKLFISDCETLAEKALQMNTSEEIAALLKDNNTYQK
jgi:phosphotransferase system enzyme I (PtsI)